MKQIKICGLSRTEDISCVNAYKPNYIGFVFAPSKRQISLEKALYLKSLLDPTIPSVGVFVNEKIDKVISIVQSGCVDVVQLHGQENDTYIEQLKEKCAIPLIKAINVKHSEDLKNIHYDVDYYLLDGEKSGSGKPFDWHYIPNLDKPYFLAGGLSLENIDAALQVPSFGIDVSSGVETNGLKDELKIEALIRRIQNESR